MLQKWDFGFRRRNRLACMGITSAVKTCALVFTPLENGFFVGAAIWLRLQQISQTKPGRFHGTTTRADTSGPIP
eukprot:2783353-Rhodomonas_salina.4